MSNISQIISSAPSPLTASQIAEAISKSESRTREILAKEVKAGLVSRTKVGKNFVYSAAASEKKPRKSRGKSSGAGNPTAKKVVNPQPTLELKKAFMKSNGGKMVWSHRQWMVAANGHEQVFLSRQLAALDLVSFAKKFNLQA